MQQLTQNRGTIFFKLRKPLFGPAAAAAALTSDDLAAPAPLPLQCCRVRAPTSSPLACMLPWLASR